MGNLSKLRNTEPGSVTPDGASSPHKSQPWISKISAPRAGRVRPVRGHRPRLGGWALLGVTLWPLCALVLAQSPTSAPDAAKTQPATAAAPTADSAAYQQFVFAYRLLQRGDDKLAIDAFDEYLERYPQDERRGDGIYYRALLARRAGDNQTAAKLLANAPTPKLLPAHSLAILRGEVYCDLGKFDPALAVLEKIDPETVDADTKASLYYLTAVAYHGSGNLPGALKSFEAAAAVESAVKPRALLEEARLDVEMAKPADAIASLQKCLDLKDYETESAAGLLAGDLAFRLKQYAKAVEFYNVVIAGHQSSPQFGPSVLGTLWAELGAKEYDAVVKTWHDVRPALQAADAYNADYLVASSQQEAGRHPDAITRFQALLAIPSAADQPRDKVTYKLALSLFETGQYSDMTKALAGFSAAFPGSPLIPDMEYLQAVADVKRGDPASGAARLTAIIAQGEANPHLAQALLYRAQFYESTKQPEPAVVDYKRFLALADKTDPPTPFASIAEASLRLADLDMRLGHFEEAQKTATTLLARKEIDPLTEQEGLYRLGLSLIRRQQLAPALTAFQTLLTKHPQNRYLGESHFYRGLLLTGLQRPDEAMPDLLAAADSTLPDTMKAQALRVASIQLREKNDDRAQSVLMRLARLVGGPTGLQPDEMIWLARRLSDAHKPDEALKYLAPLLDPQATSGAVPGSAYAEAGFVAGRCLREKKDYSAAVETFRRVIKLNHGFELESRLELARTMAAAGQFDQALNEYDKLISVEPSSIASAAIFEAAAIHRQLATDRQVAHEPDASSKEFDESRKLYKRLVLLFPFPQLSPLPELSYIELFEIETSLNEPDHAAAELKELNDHFPDGPYATYARAMLLFNQGKRGEAAFLLKKLHDQKLDERLSQRVDRNLQSAEGPP